MELLREPLGEGADVELRCAVGDDIRDDEIAADGRDIDELRPFDIGEVAHKEH